MHIYSRARDGSQDCVPARGALSSSPIDSNVQRHENEAGGLYVSGGGEYPLYTRLATLKDDSFPRGNREALASPVIHRKAGSFTPNPVWVLVS